jgi:hypothetical protein
MRFWKVCHETVNRFAWRYARPDGPEWGIALRIDKTRWLWRLNDWCAGRWTRWWVAECMRRQERERAE